MIMGIITASKLISNYIYIVFFSQRKLEKKRIPANVYVNKFYISLVSIALNKYDQLEKIVWDDRFLSENCELIRTIF